jgi:hypothetical protein
MVRRGKHEIQFDAVGQGAQNRYAGREVSGQPIAMTYDFIFKVTGKAFRAYDKYRGIFLYVDKSWHAQAGEIVYFMFLFLIKKHL